jgi:peptide/nickel transport system ATP-binding protein
VKLHDHDFSSTPVALNIRNLSVAAAEKGGMNRILADVSVVVREGETVCLVGESGAGKSVVSLAVMGLLPKGVLVPTAGTIEFEGRDLLKCDSKAMRHLRANRISMVFQEPMTALNPVMKVGPQIEEVLDNHTSLNARQKTNRVLEIMEQVHLPDVPRIYKSYPHQLSGGQRQRIMIAMALILQPKLLIADEPTTALDVTTQNQVLQLIAELQKKHGTAVLFITHDMGVVAEIADTVYVLRNGECVEHAPLEALLRSPREDYTRSLLASVPSLIPRAPRRSGDGSPVLEVTDLSKTYHTHDLLGRSSSVTAAQNVCFRIQPGRTLGIVGESGSGKSTVARCILRLIEPSGGDVRVGKIEFTKLKNRDLQKNRNKIQIIFQDPYRSLNPRWKVGESIIEGIVNFGETRDEALKQAERLAALVGLPQGSLSRYPHQFSGGQRQRIAIARALSMRPDILVADEAVSALDVSVQAQVLKLLHTLQDETGISILFITHDLRVAAQICDDVMVMQNGHVVEHNTAENVLMRPEHHYTQSLIRAAPGRHWDFANFRKVHQVAL